jgi:hypothetical protein
MTITVWTDFHVIFIRVENLFVHFSPPAKTKRTWNTILDGREICYEGRLRLTAQGGSEKIDSFQIKTVRGVEEIRMVVQMGNKNC